MIVAVVGMTREAKILQGDPALVGGGDATTLSANLEAELRGGATGVISFGLCGALDPALKVGDLVIGAAVVDGADLYEADHAWAMRMKAALPAAHLCGFARADKPIGSVAEKAELRARTGAAATDMESFSVARIARWFGVPFAVLRAVSDASDRTLPHAAQVGLGPDGRPAMGAIFSSLRANPLQIGALIRTALEAEDAFHALEHARETLGPGLAGFG